MTKRYVLRRVLTDAYGTVERSIELPSANFAVHLNAKGNGICFGGASTVENAVEIAPDLQNLPLHLTKNSFASAPTHLLAQIGADEGKKEFLMGRTNSPVEGMACHETFKICRAITKESAAMANPYPLENDHGRGCICCKICTT